MITTLDKALTRWAVAFQGWQSVGGAMPVLGAFLAGWFCRDLGGLRDPPKGTSLKDSWKKGWDEADSEIAILTSPHFSRGGD